MYICSVTVSSQRPRSPTWITLRNKATISFLFWHVWETLQGGDGVDEQLFFTGAVLWNRISLYRSTVTLCFPDTEPPN